MESSRVLTVLLAESVLLDPWVPTAEEVERLAAEAVPNWFGSEPSKYRALCFPWKFAGSGAGYTHQFCQTWLDDDPGQDPRIRGTSRSTHPSFGTTERRDDEFPGLRPVSRVSRAAFDQVWEKAVARRTG